jgi:hypothetical protein
MDFSLGNSRQTCVSSLTMSAIALLLGRHDGDAEILIGRK